jgi:hypothetical protein
MRSRFIFVAAAALSLRLLRSASRELRGRL